MLYDTENPLKAQMRWGVLPSVFIPAAGLVVVLLTVIFKEEAGAIFKAVNSWILLKI